MTARILLPKANWPTALAQAIKTAEPGDTIVIDSMAKLELCARAASRLGKTGLKFEVEEDFMEGTDGR